MEKDFYVYMLASGPNGTLYKGITSNLVQRISEHKKGINCDFSNKYNIKILVWYRQCGSAEEAIKWEKCLRRYPRQWKINLIEEMNPEWKDLFNDLLN